MRTFVTSLTLASVMALVFSISSLAAPAPACQMLHGDTTFSVSVNDVAEHTAHGHVLIHCSL
jgi:hypothetical protein